MKQLVAEAIGKKARGLKHCEKLLKIINEKGSVELNLGNTGVFFTVTKGDYMHTMISSLKGKLEHEINAIEITSGLKAVKEGMRSRTMPAPVGASEIIGTCKHCGATFTKTCNRQVYCSPNCRHEHDKAERKNKNFSETP